MSLPSASFFFFFYFILATPGCNPNTPTLRQRCPTSASSQHHPRGWEQQSRHPGAGRRGGPRLPAAILRLPSGVWGTRGGDSPAAGVAGWPGHTRPPGLPSGSRCGTARSGAGRPGRRTRSTAGRDTRWVQLPWAPRHRQRCSIQLPREAFHCCESEAQWELFAVGFTGVRTSRTGFLLKKSLFIAK